MTQVWAVVIPLLGAALLVVTLLDILTTAFHPAAESILTGYFYRVVWYIAQHASRLLPFPGRRWLLSWTFPAMIAGLLILWLLAFLTGFALLYAPSMSRPGAFSSSVGKLNWPDAFYISGMCLTSIGFGDVVPREGLLRAMAVSEGMCGLLVVGVTITYVIGVLPSLPLVRVLATTLNEETDGQVNAVPMVHRYLAVDSIEAMLQRCRELATQLIVLAEAHSSHPVLFYAHPKRVEQSFLRILVVTQQLVLLLRYGLRQADFPALVRDPRVVGLEESFIAVIRQLGRSLHLRAEVEREGNGDSARSEEYEQLLDALRAAKLREDGPTRPGEQRAYLRFRQVTDPSILAYWANTGYTAEELWANYAPLRGTTAPLSADDDIDDP